VRRAIPRPPAKVGASRPPKSRGQIVRCSSSTKPARKSAAFSSPPPSQRRRLTPHWRRSHWSAAGKSSSRRPQTLTSSASWRRRRRRETGARAVVKIMIGEARRVKIFARGSMVPAPLTMTRRFSSARPRDLRLRRNISPPAFIVTGKASIVRAPAMTASAVARRSIICRRSRALPKGAKRRWPWAILPSAVMATLMRTNGREGFMPDRPPRRGAAASEITSRQLWARAGRRRLRGRRNRRGEWYWDRDSRD